MKDIDFNTIRRRADSKASELNLIRDRLFEELVNEHKKTYSERTSELYNISFEKSLLILDLSPIGLNIKTEEKFIFINNTVMKQITFSHHDELRQKVVKIIDICLHTNGKFSFSPQGNEVGEIGNGYAYDTFFQNFFEQLKVKELITFE